MAPPSPSLLTRRQLLVGGSAAAGALLLGACSDDGGSSGGTSTTSRTSELALAQLFGGPMFVAGRPARLPFGVADADGLLTTEETPTELTLSVLDAEGQPVGPPSTVARHAEGLPRPYFPLQVTVPEPGIYTARTEIDGVGTEMSFQIHGPEEVVVIQPGSPLPAVDTPTTADAHGVDPICTADPACPLHEVSLTDALQEGRPIALLVSTPAFCQLAICGPVLDVLLGVTGDHPGVRFLHAEVYAHPEQDLDTYAPVIAPLGLHFEPCLLLAGPDGRLVERLDTIYDRAEVQEALGRLA